LAVAPSIDQAAKPTEPPRPEEIGNPPGETLPAPCKPGDAQRPDASAPVLKPIDLPTALQLADARNPLVAFTRERVQQAYAQLKRDELLLLLVPRVGGT